MRSYLDFEGMYDKSKRYLVNNWSKEDFSQQFGAENVYNDVNVIETQPAHTLTIKAGEMRELGQFEAYTFTKHFVDREMFKEAEKLDGKARERAEMNVNNPDLRKEFEDRTIQEIEAGKVAPFMDKLREKIRAEIKAEELAKKNKPKEDVKPIIKEDKKDDKKVGEFSE